LGKQPNSIPTLKMSYGTMDTVEGTVENKSYIKLAWKLVNFVSRT